MRVSSGEGPFVGLIGREEGGEAESYGGTGEIAGGVEALGKGVMKMSARPPMKGNVGRRGRACAGFRLKITMLNQMRGEARSGAGAQGGREA